MVTLSQLQPNYFKPIKSTTLKCGIPPLSFLYFYNMEIIRLAIVEDDPIIRESLLKYMSANPSIEIQLAANSMEDFFERTKEEMISNIDVLLLDIGLPGMSGLQGIKLVKAKFPKVDIVMLTTFEEDDKIFTALCAGACSYISKRTSLAQIRDAVFTIFRGGSYMSPSIARKVAEYFMPKANTKEAILTDRQKDIVQGIVDGLSYKMIANRLNISLDTVRDHIKRIYRALEINSKAELIRKSLDGKI